MMINRRGDCDWVAVVIAFLLCALARSAAAGIINGDFQSGDLTGWTASAIDGAGSPVSPLAAVGTAGGNAFAVLDTGTLASGPFISTLEQTFLVDPLTPYLAFDFSELFTQSDPTGTGGGTFSDAFAVSLQSGADFFDLLLVDASGPLADPFGTAPGMVALGVPLASGFNFTFSADLTSLAGQNVTLFLDLINEDDGLQSSIWYDDAHLRSSLLKKTFIPEPASGMIWALLVGGGAGIRFWTRRRDRGGRRIQSPPHTSLLAD